MIAPSPAVGGRSAGVAARISTRAAGYAVEVPKACTTRSPTSHQKPGTNGVAQRGQQDQRQPGHEHPPGAELVHQPAHQRLPHRRADVEAGHEPARGPDADAEVGLQLRERHRDHRGVQRVERGPEGQGRRSAGRGPRRTVRSRRAQRPSAAGSDGGRVVGVTGARARQTEAGATVSVAAAHSPASAGRRTRRRTAHTIPPAHAPTTATALQLMAQRRRTSWGGGGRPVRVGVAHGPGGDRAGPGADPGRDRGRMRDRPRARRVGASCLPPNVSCATVTSRSTWPCAPSSRWSPRPGRWRSASGPSGSRRW